MSKSLPYNVNYRRFCPLTAAHTAYLSNLNICLSRYEYQNRSIFLVASILVSLQKDRSHWYNFWKLLKAIRLYSVIFHSMSIETHRESGGASLTFCPISLDGIHKSRKSNAQKFCTEKHLACKQISQPYLLLTHNAAGYYGSECRFMSA